MKNNAIEDGILFVKLVILLFCVVFFYLIDSFGK